MTRKLAATAGAADEHVSEMPSFEARDADHAHGLAGREEGTLLDRHDGM